MGTLWIVAGLGNPGDRYETTRHNLGFMVVDALLERHSRDPWTTSSRFKAQVAKCEVAQVRTVLVKPQTFMNLSGQSVATVAHFYQVEPENVVVVHDDVDLELGRLRIKAGGGDGGHKGVRSVAQELGSKEFARVRIGVGRAAHGTTTDHVLKGFSKAEQDAVSTAIQFGQNAIETLLTAGLIEAMNRHNGAPRAEAGTATKAKLE